MRRIAAIARTAWRRQAALAEAAEAVGGASGTTGAPKCRNGSARGVPQPSSARGVAANIRVGSDGSCRGTGAGFSVDYQGPFDGGNLYRHRERCFFAIAACRLMRKQLRFSQVNEIVPVAETEEPDVVIGGNLAADKFVPLPFAEKIGPEDLGMVVRVQLTRASLAELGYPVTDTPDDDLISADVLVGEDGWPRAVRVVQ